MKRNRVLAIAVAMGLSGTAAADVRELVVEGFLTDSSGKAVIDGEYSATVQLCTAQTAGSCPWDEPTNVTTHGGYFQVRLGTNPNKPLTDALFATGASLWFELKLDTQTYPRTPIASVPYAFRAAAAGDAGTVGGFGASATPTAGKLLVLDGTGRVPAAAVPTPSSLQCTGCVDGADIGAGAVGFTNLSGAGCASGQVITWSGSTFSCENPATSLSAGVGIIITNLNKIDLDQAKVVEYAKAACYDTAGELTAALPLWDTNAADDIVLNTEAKGDLAGSYPAPSIAPAAVTTAKLADASVTSAKLAPGAVANANLAEDVTATLTQLQTQVTALQAAVADLKTRTPQGSDFFIVKASTPQPLPFTVFPPLTGNSVTLTPGEWLVNGRVQYYVSGGGTPGYVFFVTGWYGANGTDSQTAPTKLSALPGVTIQSPTGFLAGGDPVTGKQDGGQADYMSVTMTALRLKVTQNSTIYLNAAANMANPQYSNVQTLIYAERLR